jgi:ankyrin repeat protein
LLYPLAVRYQLLTALTLLGVACGPPRPWSPLAEAAGRNDTAAMKALLDAGPPGPADSPHELLMWAARNGAADAIALLAARGADLNEPDAGRNHWTPLQHAAHKQQPDAVRALLEWGAEPDATQPGNTTPLFMAADSADPTMARVLLEAGADPAWIGPGGRTPLTQAVSGGALWDVTDRPLLGGCRTATVQAFMTMYPRLRVPDNRMGNTAVMWARAHDCAQVLRLIDVNPNTRGQSARSAVGLIHEVLGVPTPRDVF